jgi:hypothetical protein
MRKAWLLAIVAALVSMAGPVRAGEKVEVNLVFDAVGSVPAEPGDSAAGAEVIARRCTVQVRSGDNGIALLRAAKKAGCIASFRLGGELTGLVCINAVCEHDYGLINRHWFVKSASGMQRGDIIPESLSRYRASDGDTVRFSLAYGCYGASDYPNAVCP